MKISGESYSWAIKHLIAEGDSDLFPPPIELSALEYSWNDGVLDDLTALDLSSYAWRGGRRLLVPKGHLSFRHGTQLHPLDSIVFAAFMKTIGARLERHRLPLEDEIVFSYRFEPTATGRFYGDDTRWNQFWTASMQRASADDCTHVLMADITDFYNQIYHHVVENQLADAGLTDAECGVVKRFMKAYSETVSRGIPVGPHSVHLLAELSLHPIDGELTGMGYDFCRYVDDYHVFCASEEMAAGALYDIANSLDAQQRLGLSKGKTKILPAEEFIELAEAMLDGTPANTTEETILELIEEHGGGDPYARLKIEKLPDDVFNLLGDELLGDLLNDYLEEGQSNFPRIGWLLRRLSQLGLPGAIDYVVDEMERLTPVLGDVARYIVATSPNYGGDLLSLGERLVGCFNLPAVARSPYVQMLLLDVLASVPQLNHAQRMTARYPTSEQATHREILRVAAAANLGAWLRGKKQDFRVMDPWTRSGYLIAAPCLPGDEGIHWLREIRTTLTPLERLVARYAFEDKALKLGSVQLR